MGSCVFIKQALAKKNKLNLYIHFIWQVVRMELYLCGLVFALFVLSCNANSEGDALYALRRNLHDPLNVLESWDPTLVDPCTWFHVTCDSNNRVTRLDLGSARLSGSLVPDLGRLTHLQYLELYKNNIVGKIPKELGNLKSLVSLDLYHNNLSGPIPATLSNLQSLRFLRLNGNKLTGKIPFQLTKLSSLKIIDLSNNDLAGTIPTSGSFSQLTPQSFENNPKLLWSQLKGSAPSNLGST